MNKDPGACSLRHSVSRSHRRNLKGTPHNPKKQKQKNKTLAMLRAETRTERSQPRTAETQQLLTTMLAAI